MAQLMPLSLTVSCFSKIQFGFTFLVPAQLGSPVTAIVSLSVSAVMCGNVAQKSQLALLYSTFHKVIQHLIVSRIYTVNIRHQQTLTLSGSLSD